MSPWIIQGLLGLFDIFRTEQADAQSRDRTDWRTEIHDNFANEIKTGDPYAAVHDYMSGNPLSGSANDIMSFLTPTGSRTGYDVMSQYAGNLFQKPQQAWLGDMRFNNRDFQQYANSIGADTSAAQKKAGEAFLSGNKLGKTGLRDAMDWHDPKFEAQRQSGRNQVALQAQQQTNNLGAMAAQALNSGQSLEHMQGDQWAAKQAIGQQQTAGNIGVDSSVEQQRNQYGQQQDQIEAGLISDAAQIDSALASTEFNANSALRNAITQGRFNAANTGANAMVTNLGNLMQARGQNAQLRFDNENARAGILQALASFADSDYANQMGIRQNALTLSDAQQKQIANEIQTALAMQMEALGIGSNLYTQYSPTVGLTAPVFQNAFDIYRQQNQPSQKSSTGFGLSIAGTGGNFSSGCVAGFDLVTTESGPKPLCEVQVGDQVLTPDGDYKAVLAKDYGTDESQEVSLRITTEAGRQITITESHPVAHNCAGNYEVGDTIGLSNGDTDLIKRIDEVPYPPSGDLYLEGNSDYCVGDFAVSSVIGDQIEMLGLDEWNYLVNEKQDTTHGDNE